MNEETKRPAVEEFKRLTSQPAHAWGMADSDVVDLCDYILYLEAAMRRAVQEEREAIAAMVIRGDGNFAFLSFLSDSIRSRAKEDDGEPPADAGLKEGR